MRRMIFCAAIGMLMAACRGEAQVPQLINYQGRLIGGTNLYNGTVSMILRLYNGAVGGTKLYEDSNSVAVVDGLYSTFIGDNGIFGSLTTALTNNEVWVEIVINSTVLSPRERLASVAYALMAANVSTNLDNSSYVHRSGDSMSGPLTNTSTITAAAFRNSSNSVGDASASAVGGTANNAGSASATVGGGMQNVALDSMSSFGGPTVGGGRQNKADGDCATVGGGYANIASNSSTTVAGGNENQALTNFATVGGGFGNVAGAPSATVGGGYRNVTTSDSTTIAGGNRNTAVADYGTVGGGRQNKAYGEYASVGGGHVNVASNSSTTVAGGNGNQALADFATVGGGHYNTADGDYATVAGGYQNAALITYATVGGGFSNYVTGAFGTVPGGTENEAGLHSFAAGTSARATNIGSFVWADYMFLAGNPIFGSAGDQTFNVRSRGGVYFSPETKLFFGSQARQMLNLWDTQYGVGVQANTQYNRSYAGFAWYKGGTHDDTPWDPGAGGTMLMWLDSGGSLHVTATSGNAVRGVTGGLNGHGVEGEASTGTNACGLWGKSTSGYAGYFDGAVKVNYSSPAEKPQLLLKDPSDSGWARLRLQTGSRPFWDVAIGTEIGATNLLRFFNSAGGDVMTLTEQGELTVNVLTIRGGADVAEPFAMSASAIPRGAVVVIDDEHPGQLKISERAYDTRVAGIVSGANGVNPGLSLMQLESGDGGQNVALSGRVYAQADASNGPIRPGDLLTTSDTPGCAMKASDPLRAQGAILGKAMSPLPEGQGLVLVLVTLQ